MRALPLILGLLVACNASTDETADTDAPVLETRFALDPAVAARGVSVEADLLSRSAVFEFGETDLDLGEGVVVESVTVRDAYNATVDLRVEPDAELGPRDLTVSVYGDPTVVADGFAVIDQSFTVEPSSGKMGATVQVDITGRNTSWERGYTWVSFGDGVDVLDLDIVADNLATALVSVRPDARPGPRDVTMESGPDVVTLTDGFMVDRAVITAFFDPPEAYQGDTVDFVVTGLDTAFGADTELEFWDAGGPNADIGVTQMTVLDGENLFGRVRLSNAARLGARDVVVRSDSETLRIPDGLTVLDAPPDLGNVAVSIGFDVIRELDNASGTLYERVQAYAYFVVPLDPPCGPAMPMGSGPQPYDVNGVFPVPPEPDPVDCPNPETVSAGDYVWFESDENVVTLHKNVDAATGMILYYGEDLTLDDYRFGQWYDLHTQGDEDGIPEVVLTAVQPTVPGDYYLMSPDLWGDFTQPRTEPFTYLWTPANTYPDAMFSTQISGTLAATGDSGFAGSIPWDDGEHTYSPAELLQLDAGPVSFQALSYIKGPEFGLPFSTIQSNQSDSALVTSASLVLE